MRTAVFSLLAFAALTIVACKSLTEQEKLMQNYLSAIHNETQLELLTATHEGPVTAADSLAVIQPLFEAGRDSALAHLKKAQVASEKAYRIAKEGYEANNFAALKPEFAKTMEQSTSQLLTINQQIAALEGDCKGTELESAYAKVMHYQALGDEVLLQEYTCKYQDTSGEHTQTVFLSPDQKAVMGYQADSSETAAEQ